MKCVDTFSTNSCLDYTGWMLDCETVTDDIILVALVVVFICPKGFRSDLFKFILPLQFWFQNLEGNGNDFFTNVTVTTALGNVFVSVAVALGTLVTNIFNIEICRTLVSDLNLISLNMVYCGKV